MSATKEPVRSLVKKLAEVMGAIDRIAKNGHNDHFNYDFATEADISAAVRGHMAERCLLLVPSVEKTEWEVLTSAKGASKKICTLTVQYTLMDGDSGEEMKFTILGQGEDSGDKATYKAMTGATKFALMKLFLIPTGNDPEKDGATRFTPRNDGPPASDGPVTTARVILGEPVRDKSTQVTFGRSKGKYFCDLDDADLDWQLAAAKKSADANDPKWGKSNKERLLTVQHEKARRLGVKPTAKKGPAIVDVQAGETEQQATERQTPKRPWARVMEVALQHGKSEAQMKTFAHQALQGKTTVSPADADFLIKALSDSLVFGGDAPPHGDEDSPGEQQ